MRILTENKTTTQNTKLTISLYFCLIFCVRGTILIIINSLFHVHEKSLIPLYILLFIPTYISVTFIPKLYKTTNIQTFIFPSNICLCTHNVQLINYPYILLKHPKIFPSIKCILANKSHL